MHTRYSNMKKWFRGIWDQGKLMFAFNRKQTEVSDIRKPYAIIGGLVILTSVIIFLMGYGCHYVGQLSKSRYEKATGVFIRNMSTQDAKNYADSKKMIYLGHILKNASLLILFLGGVIIIKPELLYYELRWIKIVK